MPRGEIAARAIVRERITSLHCPERQIQSERLEINR
jgi:hypothetical protein